jgi:DNA-binding PucR family transcriptional regulator
MMAGMAQDRTRAPFPLSSDIATLAQAGQAAIRSVAKEAGQDSSTDPRLLGSYLDFVLRAARASRLLAPAELAECRKLGRAAASEDVPLPALLDLYLSATWRLWQDLQSRAEGYGGAVLGAVAAALFRGADDAVAALGDGYQEAQRAAIRSEEALRREFVDDLLGGGQVDPSLEDRARRFGFNLPGLHRVVVARTDRRLHDAGPVHRAVEGTLRDVRTRGTLTATKDGLLVCVLPGSIDHPEKLVGDLAEQAEPGPWQIGAGEPHAGPGGVARSYGEAREAVDLAARLGLAHRVVRFADVLPYRILGRDPEALRELVDSVLGNLGRARTGGRPLIETLEAYFAASGNVSETARRLYLSPRAVTYRLATIARLTGHRPDDPEDRFVLELAVRGSKLVSPPHPEP